MANRISSGQKITFVHRASYASLLYMGLEEIEIREVYESDSEAIVSFTDEWIGKGYFSNEEVLRLIGLSRGSSFLALSAQAKIVGVRLSVAPGQISKLGLKATSEDLWPVASGLVGYFKSLFIAGSHQGMGIGRSLSENSIVALKKLGAKGIVCHSWLESPGDSSRKYLKKMGFDQVCQYPRFWFDVDYECTRCKDERCTCTAVEMIKVLDS